VRLALALLSLLPALLAPAPVHAQVSAEIVMRVDRTNVQVGEMVALEVRADVQNADNPQVELPDLTGFDVLARQVSSPVQFRFGSGGTQVIQATTIHRLTLRAREPGTFALRPAVVHAGRQQFASNPLTIVVGGTPSTGPPQQQPPGPADLPPGDDLGAQFNPNGFVRTHVENTQPYIGQQTTVSIYLYMPQRVGGAIAITPEPTTEGFWTQDLLPPERDPTPRVQDIQGYRFAVYMLRRFAAFPLRAGELTIGGTGVTVSSNNPFDRIFGGGGGPSTRFEGIATTLEVRELPEQGRPRGEVHVGRLTLSAELDRTQVPTGDAVQLTVTAEGSGQLTQLELELPAQDGLRILTPEIDDQIVWPRDVVSGTRTARWLIVPERAGTFTIPPFEIAVFDPSTQRYSVARTTALRLVAAGNPIAGGEDANDGEAPDEGRLEIRPIRTESELTRDRGAWLPPPVLWGGLALGPLLFAGALIVRVARRRAAHADPRGKKQKDAKKRLAAAQRHAAAGEGREFYGAIAQALKDVLEARLGQPVGRFTHAELRRHLTERGMQETLVESVVDELEGCDFARFSAAGVKNEEMEACLSRARALLEKLDRFTPNKEEAA
jgi:hypothetical protein